MSVESHRGRTPSVSVVIATYNRARFLPETIDSVLRQKFEDFELIVVDDGSTDETQRVLKPYGDRIRCFCQENREPTPSPGLSHAIVVP